MVLRPLEVIINELVGQVQAVLPEANTLPGSVIREAFINAPAAQVSLLYEALDTTRQAQTISEATGTNLDRIAGNFGLTRDSGRTAIGRVTLIFSDAITTTNILVNEGTVVSTDEGVESIDFTVIGTHIFRSIDQDSFAAEARRLESTLNAAGFTDAEHVATIPVQATTSGSTGNVGSFSLTRANIPGVQAITNITPMVGGVDAESDESLRRRISIVLSGLSTGTAEGLTALALSNPDVTDAFVVGPGNVLMTRDGSEFDEDGNLVKAGTGRSVDVYIRGVSSITNTETFTFVDNANGAPISAENNLLLGYEDIGVDNIFAQQPINTISSLVGSITGDNFRIATEVIDEDGNIILDGNFLLLKDFQADLYSHVVDNETGEEYIARFVEPTSTRFTVLETFQPSDLANSALGRDSVLFLTNVATINEEVVTRGSEFNGSDELTFNNVARILDVDEDVILTRENIIIQEQGIDEDQFIIFTKHTPVVEVTSVRHARLGQEYQFDLLDAETGQIQLIGRHPPQAGDVIQVSYTWRQSHLQNIEYFLQGDTVKWLREPFELPPSEGVVLLNPTQIEGLLDLNVQPLTPTYLGLDATQLTARGRYAFTINGDKARVLSQPASFVRAPSFDTTDFIFSVPVPQSTTADLSRLGRVVSVRNLTQGFEYDLESYALNTNIYDVSARVVSDLTNVQFALDADLNTKQIEVGDKLILSRKALVHHWTTTEDFTNNILGNPAVTFDPVTTTIENDQVTVKRQEDDITSATTTLNGSISTSGSLSGIVEIAGNVTIEAGTTVIVQPNTVIRFRDTNSLNTVETFQELIELDNTITTADIDTSTNILENVYIFQQPEGTAAPFFIVLSDDGTESLSVFYNQDVVRKVVATRDGSDLPLTFDWYINDTLVAEKFAGVSGGNGLLAAVETTSTFLGYRREDTDDPATVNVEPDVTRFVARTQVIDGRAQYGVELSKVPRVTGLTADDFRLFQESSEDAIFTDIAYDDNRNVLLIDNLAVEAKYALEYFISVINRLSLRVKGTLQTAADVTENTPVVFTSTAEAPAPGDWEGIIFDPTGRTDAPGNTAQSFLANCIVKYARIGIQNEISDPIIDSCVVKSCLDGGYTVNSSFFPIVGFTRSDLRLLSNDFDATGRSYPEERSVDGTYGPYGYGPVGPDDIYGTDDDIYGGYGYGYGYGSGPTSTRTLSFVIPNLLTTADGEMPIFAKVGNVVTLDTNILATTDFLAKYVVSFVPGIDYNVYIDGTRISPNVDADFAIEYDSTRGGFLLSFFNTDLTLNFISNLGANPGNIAIDFFAVFNNGTIRNSIFTDNGNAAIDINKTSFVAMENNTIDANGSYGITVESSYATMDNNLVTNFDIAGVIHNERSVLRAETNNIWSLSVNNALQNEIADTDKLTFAIDETEAILVAATPSIYNAKDIIKIDDEFMQVLDILGDKISVTRGFNDTEQTEHAANADIFLQRVKVIFTVTGIDGNECSIREATSDGALIPGREPVTMLKIAENTFRTAFSVDRGATFFYRLQYRDDVNDPFWTLTQPRRLFGFQFGNAINNFVNVNHEVGLAVGSIDSTNYSANPLYLQPEVKNYEVSDNSPASEDNPIYAIPYEPTEQRLRFLGRAPVVQVENLTVGVATIELNQVPIVATGLQTDVVVRLTSNASRTLGVSAYNNDTQTLTLSSPVTSAQVGTYEIVYNTPITLGSALAAYPFAAELNFIFNEGRVVDWTKLVWNASGEGGNIKARFRVANSQEELPEQDFSSFISVTPFDLSLGTDIFPRAPVIEFEIVLETNDNGFDTDGAPLFPKLLDVTLFLTPARDNALYKVLALDFDSRDKTTLVTIEDDENPGLGIKNTTFQTVGDGEVLSVIVRKAEDSFGEAFEFVGGEAEAIATNETSIRVKGNLLTARSAPNIGDEVVADYIVADVNDSESVVFVENGTQVTKDRFFNVNSVTAEITIDRLVADPAGEVLTINSLAQPTPGTQYLTSYTFAAPAEGETLTITYTVNDVVRSTAQIIEADRVLTSDVLVRAGFEVPVYINANIRIASGFNPNAIITDISNALAQFFVALPAFGGTITSADVTTIISGVTGVSNLTLNTLSRNPIAEVVTIELNEREYATIASGNPILTISPTGNPTQILATNST